MKNLIFKIFTVILISLSFNLHSQEKYYTKSGFISFISRTIIIDLQAKNDKVVSFINTQSGDIAFGVIMNAFKFKRPLAEEHFKENYAETDKFPKAKFKGKIINNDSIDWNKNGIYKVRVEGDLTIHGVTQNISQRGVIKIDGKTVYAKADFIIRPEEYNIKIPKIVSDKISEKVNVSVRIKYKPYNN